MRDWAGHVAAAIEGHRRTARWLLAGPGALLAATLFLAGMPVWFPPGAAAVDNIVFPMVLAPLFWAIAFTYAVLEENLVRGTAVALAFILVHVAIVAAALGL